jgi:lysophospholipase L1-like esterase
MGAAEFDAIAEARRLFDQGVPWGRYVALGDSITEGELGDPYPPYEEKGWAEMLADAFRTVRPDFKFFNLGERYKTTRDIRERQVGRALELKPDLVTVWAGGNDMLIENYDVRITETEFEAMIAALEETGATILTGTWPNIFESGVMPEELAVLIRDKWVAMNEAVRKVAQRHDVVFIDMQRMEFGTDPDIWSQDLQHINRRGQALTAELMVRTLHEHAAGAGNRTAIRQPSV